MCVADHFPDAYVGQNTCAGALRTFSALKAFHALCIPFHRHNSRKIRDTLNNLILKVCLPRNMLASCTTIAPLLTVFVRLLCAVTAVVADFGRPALLCHPRDCAPQQLPIANRALLPTLYSVHCYRTRYLPTNSVFQLAQVVEWDEVRFDVRLMQRVPYEGVSRMLHRTHTHNLAIVRPIEHIVPRDSRRVAHADVLEAPSPRSRRPPREPTDSNPFATHPSLPNRTSLTCFTVRMQGLAMMIESDVSMAI